MSIVEVPPVGGGLAALLGLVGHEPGDGLLDEPVELEGPDPVRDVRDVGVDERGRLRGSGRWWRAAIRRAFHAGRSPLGHPAPQPREPVAQLDGLPEVAAPGVGRQPERGGELGDRELRHQRRTRPGDRRSPVSP